MLERFEMLCPDLCAKWDVGIDEFGGETDHLHPLLDFHLNILHSRLCNSLKTVTSRLLRKEFSTHLAQFYWQPELWMQAYRLIIAGGVPLEVLQTYIRAQEKSS